jgi:predicted nucleotidyltransferase
MTTVKEYFANMLRMGSTEMKHILSFEDLCEIVAPIAKKRGVDRIYLFGSRARGDNDAVSDYDFYIIPGRIKSLIGLSGLMQDLEEALGSDVDIISEDPHIKEDLLQEVLRDRRLVYEA